MFVNVTSKLNFSLYRSKKKKKDFKWQWLLPFSLIMILI